MEKTIKINIPDGYDVKFNETTNEIEFVKKDNKTKNMTLLEEVKNYLKNASPEQLEKDWEFIAQFDNCGPLAFFVE